MADFKEQAGSLSKQIFSAFLDEAKTKIAEPTVYYSNKLEAALDTIDGNTIECGFGSRTGKLVCCRLPNATFYIPETVKENGSAKIRFSEIADAEMKYVNRGWAKIDLRCVGQYDVIGTAMMFKVDKDAKVTFMYNPGTKKIVAPFEKIVTEDTIASEVKSVHKKFKTFFYGGVTAETKTLGTLRNLNSILELVKPKPQRETKKQTLDEIVSCPTCKTEREKEENFCSHCGYDYRKL